MNFGMLLALTVPFLGTALGAGAVLGLPVGSERVQRGLNGFAAGAMIAAAFWNLLLPGMEENAIASAIGFLMGMGLVLAAEELPGDSGAGLSPAAVLMMAVVFHNIPEGMAVGITGTEGPGAMIGIALQNIPDGAVVAVPLAAMGMKRKKAFLAGVLSGAVEPVAAIIAMELCGSAACAAPGLMGFAAGAMVYVIIRELVPRMGDGKWGMLWFALGFVGIMSLGCVT